MMSKLRRVLRQNTCPPARSQFFLMKHVVGQGHFTDFLQIHYDDVTIGKIASQITSLTIVYSTVYSDADQRKHQSSASLAFVRGLHRDRWIPRTTGQWRGKCWRHHVMMWSFRVQTADASNQEKLLKFIVAKSPPICHNKGWINLFWPSHVIWLNETWSSLVQATTCRLFDAKSLPEPMLNYCDQEQASESTYTDYIWIFIQWNACSGSYRPCQVTTTKPQGQMSWFIVRKLYCLSPLQPNHSPLCCIHRVIMMMSNRSLRRPFKGRIYWPFINSCRVYSGGGSGGIALYLEKSPSMGNFGLQIARLWCTDRK